MKRLVINLDLDTADGGVWWATLQDHINLQESPTGIGSTPLEALQELLQQVSDEDIESNLLDRGRVFSYRCENGDAVYLDQHRAQGGRL